MAKQNKNKNTKFNLSKRIGKTVEIGTEIENILEYYNLDDKMEETEKFLMSGRNVLVIQYLNILLLSG